jgi:hypothetical protein
MLIDNKQLELLRFVARWVAWTAAGLPLETTVVVQLARGTEPEQICKLVSQSGRGESERNFPIWNNFQAEWSVRKDEFVTTFRHLPIRSQTFTRSFYVRDALAILSSSCLGGQCPLLSHLTVFSDIGSPGRRNYNSIMARGWESKSVEAQQSDAQEKSPLSKARMSPEQASLFREKEKLHLARSRVLQQMENSTNPKLRKMLENALYDLDQKLRQLS